MPPARREYVGIKSTGFFVNKSTKNHPLVKRTIKYVLFNSCSYKNSCFSELAYNSSVPVLNLKKCSPRF